MFADNILSLKMCESTGQRASERIFCLCKQKHQSFLIHLFGGGKLEDSENWQPPSLQCHIEDMTQ